MPSPSRVVLLHDGSWPATPGGDGGDGWRRLGAALAAAGAEVTERTCRPLPPAGSRRQGWWQRLARLRRLPGLWRLPGLRRLPAAGSPASRAAVTAVAGADLVIAGSAGAAAAAIAAGTPRRQLWVLVPPVASGPPGSDLAGLGDAAGSVGGFLVDSEDSRSWVERLTAAYPTRVVLLPPGDPAAQRAAVWDLLDRVQSQPPPSGPLLPAPSRPARSVLVAGYDLRFAANLADRLDRRTDLSVTVDDWPELGRGTRHTRARLRNADAIFAEWARPSAVWLSRRKRPGQFLAVRLHRYELDFRYPRDLTVGTVDAIVYIAPLFGRRIRDELGWPPERLVYIPNYLDLDWLNRPKLPDARFAVGFVGIEWSRKRFDLALDLIAALRREDPRFTLVVRSQLPWHNRYAWADPTERAFVARCFRRVEQDPLLREGVHFDAPGRDMARWYRRIGHLASTSDAEGSHASVAEAMAAGSVPVVRAWPGAAEVYGAEWVHGTTEEAVAAVRKGADPQVWLDRAARARAEVRRTHNPDAVVAAWADLLHGDLPAARHHFAGDLDEPEGG